MPEQLAFATITVHGMIAEVQKFDAFISYSHHDESAARRIQNFLQRYKLPRDIAPGRGPLRVFRDATDIRTGALSDELNGALDAARTLIVCCSPAALESHWVAQEIDRFLEIDPTRSVIPALLRGDPAASIPPRLKLLNHRFADLRSAWLAGWLKPKARDELIRALAMISGVELRQLIPWEKRRRRKAILITFAALSIIAVGTAMLPIETTRKLDQPQSIGADQTVEYCDVAGDRLVLAASQKIKKQNAEETNDVQYTMLYRDALNPAAKGIKLENSDYLARNRLIHASLLRSAQKLIGGAERATIYAAARKRAENKYDYVRAVKDTFRGLWAAEPRPGLKVLLFAVRPSPSEGADGPPPGNSIVVVSEDGKPMRLMTIEGLYPSERAEKTSSTPAAALIEALPIVASGKDVYIGMAIRKDRGQGGLWHWNGSNPDWELQKVPRSINSLIADPHKPGRVLMSTAPGPWESAARKGQVAAQFFERPDDHSDWREIQLVPADSQAQVQLCGFRSDGTLYLRSQQALFALGRQRLYQRIF